MSRDRSHEGEPYDIAGATSGRMHGTKKDRLDDHAPPVADPAMFCGVLGEIVTAADPTTEADPVGVLASLLASAGVVIGPSPHVQVGNTRHPLLVWPLLFGRTGSGRKGEAGQTAETFIRTAAPDSAGFTVSGLSSGEGLVERIKDPCEVGEDEIRRKKSAGGAGTTDKRLLVVEPEFSSVMARAKREGSTLAAVLRQAWDGRALSVLNRSALSASGSHIAIVGHVTPREFRLRLAETEMAGGTYNRFLPIYVERSKRLPLPGGVTPAQLQDLAGRLSAAIGQARHITQLALTGPSVRLWSDELYDEFTEADDEDSAWTEFARRGAPYCLRIAGLFTVLDSRRQIQPVDLVAAAALVRYSIASARHVLDRQHRDPRLDRIRRALDGAAPERLTRTQVSELFSRNLSREQLDLLLEELLKDDRYEITHLATRGRPAATYGRRLLSS